MHMTTKTNLTGGIVLLPRIIRFRDAPMYLGMDRNRFNNEVRDYVTEIKIGVQGIGFDRLELDQWAAHYILCNGRPAKFSLTEVNYGT